MKRSQVFSSEEFKGFIQDTCARLDEMNIIHRRNTRLVLRRTWLDGSTVVTKLWARQTLRGSIRRAFGVSAASYEWHSLNRIRSLGVPVPDPIAFGHVDRNATGYNEALVMEDLGETLDAADSLMKLIAAGDEEAVNALEEAVIQMTVSMVRGRIIDYDHSMVNIVVTQSGKPYRLDLEQARKVPAIFLYRKRYVRMLGQLIGSYIFAVQPDTGRAVRFAERLFENLKPSRALIRDIQAHVDQMMLTQFEYNGMSIKIKLPT